MRTLLTLIFTVAITPLGYYDEKPTPTKRFDFSFVGGTAKQLVEALEAASGTSIRSLIPQRMAANNVIPSVSLKDTSIESVLLSLSKLKGKTVGIWTNVEEVWVLMEAEQEVRAIYIGHLLDTFGHVKIAETIQSSWRRDDESVYNSGGGDGANGIMYSWRWGAQSAPFTELIFHPETKVLIAKATPAQVRVAVDMVEQVGISVKALPGKTPSGDLKAEQGGADQPATAVDSKPDGTEKAKPESKGRSQ